MFGINPLAKQLNIAESTARNIVRNLEKKGIIEFKRSRRGHEIHVLLPSEIENIIPKEKEKKSIDIEKVDFFAGRTHVEEILKRENGLCFFCMKKINGDNCELDHAISVAKHGDNSFRNIVASCHECNTTKGDMEPDAFIRSLYRANILSKEELENRMNTLERLQTGNLKPDVNGI